MMESHVHSTLMLIDSYNICWFSFFCFWLLLLLFSVCLVFFHSELLPSVTFFFTKFTELLLYKLNIAI